METPQTRSFREKKILVADLDGTIAPSKSRVEENMSRAIAEFLKTKKLAVISGGRYEQFQKQLVSGITDDPKLLSNLYLFPTCATAFYMFKTDRWEKIYSEDLSEAERKLIISAFEKALDMSGYKKPEKTFGEIIEDRGTQVTFSAFGQASPLELKNKWDPDQAKRKIIRMNLEKLIPQFEINIGGATSIDVTKKGIDKAYGIKKISQYLGYGIKEMLFVGDALFEGGNDYPVKRTGVECIQVSGPSQTMEIIQQMI